MKCGRRSPSLDVVVLRWKRYVLEYDPGQVDNTEDLHVPSARRLNGIRSASSLHFCIDLQNLGYDLQEAHVKGQSIVGLE